MEREDLERANRCLFPTRAGVTPAAVAASVRVRSRICISSSRSCHPQGHTYIRPSAASTAPSSPPSTSHDMPPTRSSSKRAPSRERSVEKGLPSLNELFPGKFNAYCTRPTNLTPRRPRRGPLPRVLRATTPAALCVVRAALRRPCGQPVTHPCSTYPRTSFLRGCPTVAHADPLAGTSTLSSRSPSGFPGRAQIARNDCHQVSPAPTAEPASAPRVHHHHRAYAAASRLQQPAIEHSGCGAASTAARS